ncbi:TetR/AcrR family transcriptional regulator [Actinoplanes sp. NPDC051470]|uniref:TetR/AcrR family transcriptional regulator n=1 Tax=Actinoplanes sp. NPDC051470 TaxID=3157224 RepID=UPI003439D85E
MTDETARRRAPGMTPEERRAMIVRAALPLVAEFGGAVTTAQVARAAGIGEATVFRAFDDKDALIRACIAEALNPADMLRELHSIPLDTALEDRLLEAAEALDAHLGRMGAVMGAIHASGMPHRRPPRDRADANPDRPAAEGRPARPLGPEAVLEAGRSSGREAPLPEARSSAREASRIAVAEAITDLMEPDRAELRVSPAQAAGVFLQSQFGRPPVMESTDRRLMIDLFLHGALRREPTPA